MMLPVSVMKVMPTATQPMNEMALSSALMLIGEVKPGVVNANSAIADPPTTADGQHQLPRPRAAETKPRTQRDVAHAAATRVGNVGQHAMHVRLAAAIAGDLPAAIHADDDVGHAEHFFDVGRRHPRQ